MNDIVIERGIFWISDAEHDDSVPKRNFIPGSLQIDEAGHAEVQLEGKLLRSTTDSLEPVTINGILHGQARYVCILDARFSGESWQKLGGLMQQKFYSSTFLIGEDEIGENPANLAFDSVILELKGMEHWFDLKSIEMENVEGKFIARHKELPKISYDVSNGKLHVEYRIKKPRFRRARDWHLILEESASIRCDLNASTDLKGILREHRSLQDFVILVSNVSFSAGRPRVKLAGRDCWYDAYSLMSDEAGQEASSLNLFLSFPSLQKGFGDLYTNWRQRGDSLRAGFYLLSANRRATSMYEEHRFISLVWGLEAFHRAKWGGNITLRKRLIACLGSLPVDFDKDMLNSFCAACADLRNQISHIGGSKAGTPYSSFIDAVIKQRLALEPLYHLLILTEIGICRKKISEWFMEGPQSYNFRRILSDAGLIASTPLQC